MEPFRALVADKLNEDQRTYGFVLQTLIIGIGTWVASNLPWFVTKMGVSNEAIAGEIPMSIKVAFAIGALVFFLSILFTILTTSEYPPEDLEAFRAKKKQNFSQPAEGAVVTERSSNWNVWKCRVRRISCRFVDWRGSL